MDSAIDMRKRRRMKNSVRRGERACVCPKVFHELSFGLLGGERKTPSRNLYQSLDTQTDTSASTKLAQNATCTDTGRLQTLRIATKKSRRNPQTARRTCPLTRTPMRVWTHPPYQCLPCRRAKKKRGKRGKKTPSAGGNVRERGTAGQKETKTQR